MTEGRAGVGIRNTSETASDAGAVAQADTVSDGSGRAGKGAEDSQTLPAG
ncbi:hypothetical protein ACWD0Z_08240 [Streptomyces sp. NPDC003007]